VHGGVVVPSLALSQTLCLSSFRVCVGGVCVCVGGWVGYQCGCEWDIGV